MSYTQDKAHSSAMLGAILDGEKAQQQQQQQQQQESRSPTTTTNATKSDSASIFSTSSFGSAKALLKKHKPGKSGSGKSGSGKSGSGKSGSSSSGSSKDPTEAELLRTAQRNQVRMNF
ncbi:hypothetical protein M426DRAFT_324569 [Hypoxylon sp. CI-4A]|nr:hypothetical protein M426DRAFT_324569 [Hypoxylon sp. CI-4A]